MSNKFSKIVFKYAKDAGFKQGDVLRELRVSYDRIHRPIDLSIAEYIKIRDRFHVPSWLIERTILKMLRGEE